MLLLPGLLEILNFRKILLTLFVIALLKIVYVKFFAKPGRKGKTIPCMRGLPLLGNTHQLVKHNSKIISMNTYLLQAWMGLAKMFEKEKIFGYTLGPLRYYGICNAKHAETILKSTVMINKPIAYDSFKPWLGEGLLTSKAMKWKVRRKFLTPTFHFKVLDSFQPIIAEKSKLLVNKLTKHPNLEKCNVDNTIQMALMDGICETAMGYSVNALDGHSTEYVHHLHVLCDGLIKRMFNPWYGPDILWNNSSAGKAFNQSNEYVQDFLTKIISQKKREMLESGNANLSSRPAFLDLLLREHLKDPSFTDKDMLDEVNTFMFAGQDTTASAMAWNLFMIGHNPDVQEKVAEELYSVFGDEKTSTITNEDLKELKYLECTIKEAQRIFPSVPVFLRKIEADFWLDDDYMIPKNGTAAIFTRVLAMDEEQFPEPMKCKPERFLAENTSGRNPFSYIPFSAGPRNCVGQRFAMLEMKTMLADILRNFKVTSLDHVDKIPMELQTVSKPAIVPQYRLEKRNF